MMHADWLDRLARRAADDGEPKFTAAAPLDTTSAGITRGAAISLAAAAGAAAWLKFTRPATAAPPPSGPLKKCLDTCAKREPICLSQPPCSLVSEEAYKRYFDKNCMGCSECIDRCRAASAAYAGDRNELCLMVHSVNCANDHSDCNAQCEQKCTKKRCPKLKPPPPRTDPPIQPPPPGEAVDYCAPCVKVGGTCCGPIQPGGNICACAGPGIDCKRYGCG